MKEYEKLCMKWMKEDERVRKRMKEDERVRKIVHGAVSIFDGLV